MPFHELGHSDKLGYSAYRYVRIVHNIPPTKAIRFIRKYIIDQLDQNTIRPGSYNLTNYGLTVWCQIASVMFALYSLAAWLTSLASPAASRISARYPNSTVSIAFAGVRKAIVDSAS